MNTGGLPSEVTIVEVGPRDGLQNEATPVPTDLKVEFVNRLSESGLTEIEVSSFVKAESIPQLADAYEVFSKIRRDPGVLYTALVPNEKGLDRALEAKVDGISIFTAASETFCRKNVGCSIDESLERYRPVVERARDARMPVRAYVSTSFGCPFEGPVTAGKVAGVCLALMDMGVEELSVSDTIGVGTPAQVRRVLEVLLDALEPTDLALHFHDTRGMAIANIFTGLEYGIRVFDSSAGGLGGCPYAPGASGNVATEDLLFLLRGLGIGSEVDPRVVAGASDRIGKFLGRPLPARNRWGDDVERFFPEPEEAGPPPTEETGEPGGGGSGGA